MASTTDTDELSRTKAVPHNADSGSAPRFGTHSALNDSLIGMTREDACGALVDGLIALARNQHRAFQTSTSSSTYLPETPPLLGYPAEIITDRQLAQRLSVSAHTLYLWLKNLLPVRRSTECGPTIDSMNERMVNACATIRCTLPHVLSWLIFGDRYVEIL